MHSPILLDTTLRDGEQSPGLYFTNDEKLLIAQKLSEIGVGIIEAGIPSMGEEEHSVLDRINKLGLKSEILSWNRLVIEDVISSFRAGISSIHVSIPTSDIMIAKKLKKQRDWIFTQMESVIGFAVREGAKISLGAEDASRTDPVFLKKIFKTASGLGASRVRFADTLGIMTPSLAFELMNFLSEDLTIPIDFHGHNDFGMATANALSAWEGGADVISCSALGLGERAGNTSLEEFSGVIRYLKGGIRGFNFVALKELCNDISSWTGITMPDKKPLFGKSIYTHESGIHVDGILKDPSTYEFFPPEQIGEKRRLVAGKHSGRKAIHHISDEEGFFITDEQIDTFLKEMRKQMAKTRGIDAGLMLKNFLMQNAERKAQ